MKIKEELRLEKNKEISITFLYIIHIDIINEMNLVTVNL